MAQRHRSDESDQQLRDQHLELHRELRLVPDGGMNESSNDMRVALLNQQIANIERRMVRRGMHIPGPYHPSELQVEGRE